MLLLIYLSTFFLYYLRKCLTFILNYSWKVFIFISEFNYYACWKDISNSFVSFSYSHNSHQKKTENLMFRSNEMELPRTS